MMATPTDKGAFAAGIAFSGICWASLFKLNDIAELLRLRRWVDQEKVFDWIGSSRRNQSIAILFTEIFNFSVHGISSVSSTAFALGSTVVNALFIFLVIPFRYKMRRDRAVRICVESSTK